MSAEVHQERKAAICAAYLADSSLGEIATRFNVCKNTVSRIVRDAGLSKTSRVVSPLTPWTPERLDLLKKLWGDGYTASHIAAQLGGTSRHSILGKIHRLGLEKRLDPRRQPKSTKAKARKPGSSCGHITVNLRRRAARVDPGLPAEVLKEKPIDTYRAAEEVLVPVSRRVSLVKLKDGMCRWPLGDPLSPDFVFCGGDCSVGRPYCPAHASVAFVVGKDLKAAINSMARAWPK